MNIRRHTKKNTMAQKLVVILAALLLACSFQACTKGKSNPLTDLNPVALDAEEYTVNRGDTLNVQVWGEPRVSGQVLVRNDGRFTMPLINEVKASGKTLQSLSEEVASLLSEFITTASVSISVSNRAPTAYYLSGSFQRPGEYRSDKNIKLLQAIATGGGFAPFADQANITLIRPNASGPGDKRYHLNYNRVVAGKEPNPVLRDGDTLTVN